MRALLAQARKDPRNTLCPVHHETLIVRDTVACQGTEEPVHINSWPQDEGWLVLRVALECEKCPFMVSVKLEE